MIELTSSPFPEVGGGLESSNSKYRVVSEKEMIPHSSILAWRIPWTEEPGELLCIPEYKFK